MRGAAWVLLVVASCSAPRAQPAAGGAAGVVGAAGPADRRALALTLNDVSVLLPLPRDPGAPVLAALSEEDAGMIDRGAYDAVVARGDIAPRAGGPVGFVDFHVVAVRFDLCDRSTVGPCPRDAVGRLRLVLQPLYLRDGVTFAHDIALHAFYAIPPEALAGVVDELRGLARRQAARSAVLAVSPAAAAGDAAYLGGLRGLVRRYARAANLMRLTVIGQLADSAAFAWVFRGVDRAGDGFAPLVIPGIEAAQQTAQLAGGDTVYRVDRMVDAPAGFALATNGPRFAAATAEDRAAAVAALAEVQNPTRHDTGDTQCIGCHLATYLTARRAAASQIDPASLAAWFASPGARGVHTIASDDPRVVRAFGWAGNVPAISQRVVNDTATALAEIEARFPAHAVR